MESGYGNGNPTSEALSGSGRSNSLNSFPIGHKFFPATPSSSVHWPAGARAVPARDTIPSNEAPGKEVATLSVGLKGRVATLQAIALWAVPGDSAILTGDWLQLPPVGGSSTGSEVQSDGEDGRRREMPRLPSTHQGSPYIAWPTRYLPWAFAGSRVGPLFWTTPSHGGYHASPFLPLKAISS